MRKVSLVVTFVILVLSAACAPAAAPAAPTAPPAPVKVQLALGFVPSVQSAPYYLAQDRGYFAAEGLEVDIRYGTIQNLLKQVSDGTIEFASVSGDSLMPQRQQGVNVTYIMSFWTKNPIGLAAIAGKNNPPMTKPSDLKGKNIGISAPNSSTDFGLKALLQAGKLSPGDVTVTAIGTTEVEAMVAGRIDGAMTFLPNESAQLKSMEYKTESIAVADYIKLVPPGIATGDITIKNRADIVQRFVNAAVRGLKDALTNPDAAFQASLKRLPELTPDKQPLQRDVLAATFEYYKPAQGVAVGGTDPAVWPATQDFLKSIGVLRNTIEPTQYYSNKFVEAVK